MEEQPKQDFDFDAFLENTKNTWSPTHNPKKEFDQSQQLRTDLTTLYNRMYIQEKKGVPLGDEQVFSVLEVIDEKYGGKRVEEREAIMKDFPGLVKFVKEKDE